MTDERSSVIEYQNYRSRSSNNIANNNKYDDTKYDDTTATTALAVTITMTTVTSTKVYSESKGNGYIRTLVIIMTCSANSD